MVSLKSLPYVDIAAPAAVKPFDRSFVPTEKRFAFLFDLIRYIKLSLPNGTHLLFPIGIDYIITYEV